MVTQDPNMEILEGMYGRRSDDVVANTNNKTKRVQYWRKCGGCQIHTKELGWITLGPSMSLHTSVEYYEFQQSKHAQPLEKYGTFLAGHAANEKYDVVTQPHRRLEPLIEHNGIHEMPLDQMVAYNFHRIPVIVKYVPELANVVDHPCQFGCPPNKTFNSIESLQKHIKVWHADVAQPQAIGREISKAIDVIGERSAVSPELISAVALAVRDALKTGSPS